MTTWVIPTRPTPENFTITLGSVDYGVRTRWNRMANCWVMDFLDQAGAEVLTGVPLVTGADLFEQFKHLGLGAAGELRAGHTGSDHDARTPPAFDNFGITAKLFFVTG